MFIGTRKPKCVVMKTVTSTSGKYKLFYGYHFVKGKHCYDVGTVNQQTGEIITRHYQDAFWDSKAEALHIFHKLEKSLTRAIETEEKDVNDPWIADAFRRALQEVGK